MAAVERAESVWSGLFWSDLNEVEQVIGSIGQRSLALILMGGRREIERETSNPRMGDALGKSKFREPYFVHNKEGGERYFSTQEDVYLFIH